VGKPRTILLARTVQRSDERGGIVMGEDDTIYSLKSFGSLNMLGMWVRV